MPFTKCEFTVHSRPDTISIGKSISEFYSILSESSHANIIRNRTATEYSSVNTNLFFDYIKSYCYFNIEAYLEGNFKLLMDLQLTAEILSFLNKCGKNLGTITENVYFYPNKNNLQLKMNTKPNSRKL